MTTTAPVETGITTTTTTAVTISENGISYTRTGNSLYVTGCDPKAKELNIPEKSGDLQVAGLWADAFAGSSVETVTLPDTIAYLPEGAFRNAAHLKTVKFSNKIESIPNDCFDGCTALTSLPAENIRYINRGGFRGCTSLNISTWGSLEYMYTGAFEGCTALTSFSIPDKMTEVPNACFKNCTSLKNIELNDKITWIGVEAFDGCSALTTIRIPAECGYISAAAFRGCSALVSVLLPEKLTTVYERAFADCAALESVTSMTKQTFSVNTDTFLNCPKLKELTYHSSSLSYGSHSLGYLLDADGNYTKNTVPVNVIGLYNSSLETLISEGVITCTPVGLTYHVIPDTDTICIDFIAVPEDFSENTCYIPASIDGKTVAVIGNGTQCVAEESFKSIYIPETVTEIGDYAFTCCRTLRSFSVNRDSQLKRIGLQAFYGTEMQKDVQIRHGEMYFAGILYRCFTDQEQYTVSTACNQIAADAFAHNRDLKQIVLHDKVTAIDDGAFYDCQNLETITIPDSVVSLGTGAFVDCTALKSAKLGSGLAEIGSDLFAGCTALETVTAPEGSAAAKWCKDNGYTK